MFQGPALEQCFSGCGLLVGHGASPPNLREFGPVRGEFYAYDPQ